MGKVLRHGHKVKKRILLHRSRSAFPVLDDLGVANPMEMELHVQPVPLRPDDEIRELKRRLTHDDLEPLAHYFDRHNRYSDWEAHLRVAAERVSSSASARTRQGKMWSAVPFKPFVFFVYSYIVRLGFLDGRAGLWYAMVQSQYYWQIELKVRQLKQAHNKAGTIISDFGLGQNR
jgi:hypothetical protein